MTEIGHAVESSEKYHNLEMPLIYLFFTADVLQVKKKKRYFDNTVLLFPLRLLSWVAYLTTSWICGSFWVNLNTAAIPGTQAPILTWA